jgi:hypothetical protein
MSQKKAATEFKLIWAMASSNPFMSPYTPKTERIPLAGNTSNRLGAATKDQVFYNVIPESIKNEVTDAKKVWLSKRGGFTAETTVVGGGGVGRAIFYWSITGKVYTVIGSKLYANATDIKTLATSTGTCWIIEFLSSSGTPQLIVGDGVDLYTVSSSDVVAEIVDADLPSTQITPVFFDSYVFIVKSSTPSLYNSDVDDPTAWDPTNFLSAEQYPDYLIAICRQANYVIGFGPKSTEFFFDNANASGSPLARQETISLKVGLAARDSIAQLDRRVFWVGQTESGEPSAWMFEGITGAEISNEFVRRILTAEGSSLPSAKAWVCSHKGHTLYVLNLAARTLVYDCGEKVWTDWSSNNAGAHAVLPFNYATEGANNKVLVLHSTDGKIYRLNPDVHTDDAGAILATIITDRVDLNTNHLKQQLSLTLIGDIQSSGSVTVDWSDDDYTTWSSSRTLDLTASRAFTKAGGTFRRRAYRLAHTANAPFRVETLELEYQQKWH